MPGFLCDLRHPCRGNGEMTHFKGNMQTITRAVQFYSVALHLWLRPVSLEIKTEEAPIIFKGVSAAENRAAFRVRELCCPAVSLQGCGQQFPAFPKSAAVPKLPQHEDFGRGESYRPF